MDAKGVVLLSDTKAKPNELLLFAKAELLGSSYANVSIPFVAAVRKEILTKGGLNSVRKISGAVSKK